MAVLLCIAAVSAGTLILWLVHVARREAGFFRQYWLGNPKVEPWDDYGAGRGEDLLPQERKDNAYLNLHRENRS